MKTLVQPQLGEFASAWDAYVGRSPLASPFLLSDWLVSACRGEPIFLLVVEHDRLLGGLALQRQVKAGVEWLELMGSGPLEPDHLDLVADPAQRFRVAEMVRSWLARPGSRVLDFKGVAGGAVLVDAAPGRGEVTVEMAAPYVTLPATAAEYLAARPGALRSTITRSDRRLTKAGVVFRRADGSDPEALDAALDSLGALHDTRWGDESAFLQQWASVCAAVRAMAPNGTARIHEMVDADGNVISSELDLVLGDRMSFYQAGRRTEREWRGVGSVLRQRIIAAAIDEGLVEFDLLRGGENYKTDWANAEREVLRIRKGVGVRGAAIVGAARANVAVQAAREQRRRDASASSPAPGEPTRIVFYTDSTQIGGAESVAKNLLAELDARFEVLLVGCSQAVLDDIAAVRPAASVLVLPRINDKSDVAAMVLHRRTFRMLEPDLFHFNLSEGSSCQYAMAAALTVRGAKVIATENSPKGVRSDLSRRIKAMTAPRLAAHVAVGEAAARLVERDIGLAEGSVSVIPNGVPPIEHHPGPRVAAGLVVGALSRFDPVKGLDVLIDAVPLIEGATVEIIGDGPLRGELEAQIADLGVVERVDLRGWIDGARHELPNFDVFVLPSRLEGMPMSVIEAMQAGVAVVATDVGSVGEVVEDGVTGRVVVPGDPVALADAINELLADSALRQRLASAGQKVALERFSSAANVAAYERLYDEVLGRR